MSFTPIVIVGVPRSGTTLLRVLLGSHSAILALPETPWLTGAYGRDPSLREMLSGLAEGPYGPVANVDGVSGDDVAAAGRHFLEVLFARALRDRGKEILAFKTPADIRHLDFLIRLMPDARYVHITRDGRDVALSQLAKRGTFFKDLKEYRRVSFGNAFRRWVEWERRARTVLSKNQVRCVHLRYENLVTRPDVELQRVLEFLNLPFEAGMLDYASKTHDLPKWEAGSTDVASNDQVSAASVGKWRHMRLTPDMLATLLKYDADLVELGYAPTDLNPNFWERAMASAYPWVNRLLDSMPSLPNFGGLRRRAGESR